ncbi:DUF294 nucleotidyltransferase-like domain-containing protein [Bacillus thermotolerans]|uniref:DUF294 nucleotidyltransferase-like domain-containing protein n=1 Tax=Bacillus thermotolerans TaxID=1221996 RepID=UPI00057DA4E4|nr:DUF294 nucleotidyltransferase-like domain-containing protein [Bacillus thermotolerans]KKB36664.1 putative signal-transduction protein [Bacillus thermotolerans]KKB39905.1 putative signal-transduction protein [Bacillus thermotolerans]
MEQSFTSFKEIKHWHDQHLLTHQFHTDELNHFHESIRKNIFFLTLKEVKQEYGSPPCSFTWFVVGSAGRWEQAVHSDQDHGIMFEKSGETEERYFLLLGKRLSENLYSAGYPYCDGKVMSHNPVWCRSRAEWAVQVKRWLEAGTWEAFRYLHILFDAREVIGPSEPVRWLKRIVGEYLHEHPSLLKALMENMLHVESGVGLFNHFIKVRSGPYTGSLDIKHTAFFPYVNAARILAMKENIERTATLERLEELGRYECYSQQAERAKKNFQKLLHYRLMYSETARYEDAHYLYVNKMNAKEKSELKQIIKGGKELHRFTQEVIERAVHYEC